METITNISEDASIKSCVTKIESEEKNISQENGEDVYSKHPLSEESREANSGKTDEVSEPMPQEIYQESSQACVDCEKQAEEYNIDNKLLRNTDEEGQVTMEVRPKSSSPEDEDLSPLPTLAFAKVDVIEEIKKKPHQTVMEEIPTSIDNNFIEHEQITKVLEGIALPESMDKACIKKEHTDQQSETQSMEKEIIKHIDSKEMMETERGTKMNYETRELERIPKSHSDEDLQIKDGGNVIIQEEAENIKDSTDVELQKPETESVPDDRSTSTLPSLASIQDEKSLHEEIHREAESAVEDTNERQKPYNDFEENLKIIEALDVQETTVNTSMENEKEDQPQYQAQIQETLLIKHLNSEGMETAQTTTRNNTDEFENIPLSHTREKLENEDCRKLKHEEAKEMGEERDKQLPKITKESENGYEATSMLPNLVVIEEVEMPRKSFGKETVEEEESPAIDNNQSLRLQNELEQMSKPPKVIDQPQIMDKDAAKTEHNGSQSESPSLDNAITMHSNSEESLNMKGNAKPNYDVKERERTQESDLILRLGIKCGGKIMPEKETDIKEADEEELQKSEAQSVPADKVRSTLHPTGPVSVETVEQSIIKEIHQEVESAATDIEDGQRLEKDLEEIKKVLEVFDLHEEPRNTNQENREKTEIQTEVQNLDNLVIKHLNLEGETIELNMINNAGDCEKVPMSRTEEETQIKERRKCVHEEARDMEEATEDEVFPTMTTLENVKGEAVEEIFQEQNLKEEESAAILTDFNVDEVENISMSQSVYNSEILDGGKILTDEATNIKKATNVDIHQSKIESVPEDIVCSNLHFTKAIERVEDNIQEKEMREDEGQSKLLISEIVEVKGEKLQKIIQKETLQEEESAAIAIANSCRPENELEKMVNIDEANNQSETIAKVEAENEEQVNHLSEVSSVGSIIIKHIDIEEKVTSRSTSRSSYDIDKLEKTSESHSVKNSKIKDDCKITQEDATDIQELTNVGLQESEVESVPEDKDLSNLHNTVATRVEAVTESIEEDLRMDAEQEEINTKEGQMHENNFEVHKQELDLHDMMDHANAENEKKAKPQPEVTNLETTITMHPTLEGETEETTPTKDTEEKDNARVSHVGETLHIEVDGKCSQEEANKLEQATDMKILKTAIKSVTEDEAQSELPMLAIVKAKTEETLQQETHQKQPVVVYNDESCRPTNEQEKMTNAVKVQVYHMLNQALDQPKTIAKDCAKQGEHADHLSQASSIDIVLPEQINEEGKKTSESSTKSSSDLDQQNITGKHTVKNPDLNDGSEITPEVATDIKRSEKTETTISETEETIIQQEIHTDAELDVKDKKEGQLPENDFEERKEVSEPFFPQEVAKHTNSENGLKAEPQYEAQNQETTFIKHLSLQGNTTDITNPCGYSDVKDQEKVPVSPIKDKSEIEEEAKFKQEEAKEIEDVTEMQLRETASENLSEDKALQTPPSTASVSVDTVDKSIHEEIYAIAELAVANSLEGQTQEIGFEKKNEVYKDFSLHEVTCQISTKSELSSEEQNQAITFMKHLNLGQTTETHPTNDTEEQEKVPTSQSKQKLDIEGDGKFTHEEAKEMEEAEIQLTETATESVLEDEAQSTIPILPIVNGEGEEILPIQKPQEDENAAIDNDKTCRQENEPEKKDIIKDLLNQAFDLYQVRHQTNVENKLNAEPQSEAQKQDSTFIKQPNSEGKTTDIRNPTNNTEEQKIVTVLHDRVKLDIIDDGKLIQGEATGIEEVTEIQLLKTTTKSVPENETESTMPTLAFVKGENEESAVTDNNSSRRKHDLGETVDAVKEIDHPKAMAKVTAEDEEREEHQSEASGTQSMITKDINAKVKEASESYTNSSQSKVKMIPKSHSVENSEIDDGSKIRSDEKTDMKESTDEEIQSNEKESVPEDNVQPTFPNRAIISVEAADRSIQQETHMEGKLAVSNTKEGIKVPENDFEEQKKVPEAFDLHEVTQQTTTKNKQKDELQSEEQNHETTIVMHLTSEEKTAEISPTNETGEQEKPKLEIEDDGRFILEEAKVMQEATGIQLLETASECKPKDENHSTLPTSTTVKGDNIEEFIKEQTIKEEESAAIDEKIEEFINNNSFRPKNKLEQTTKVVEIMDSTIIKRSNIEGLETTEISPSVDVEELEKIATEKVGIKDGEEIKQEDTTEMQSLKTATESVQDDEAPTTSPILAIVQSEVSGQSFQEQTLREEESTVIDNKRSRPESELQPRNQILEPIAQPETADHVSEVTSILKVITQKNKSEGMMTTDSGRKISYDVEEHEKIAETLFTDNSKNKDASKIIEEANIVKEATDVELPKSETASVPEDLSTITYIKYETFEKGIQEEIYKEAESSVTDTKEGQRLENEFEGNIKIQEAFDLHKDAGYASTENEKKPEVRYEAQIQENVVIKHPKLEGLETQTSLVNDTNELEKEYKVAKSGDVSELLSADIMQQACSNEDVPMQKDQTTLSNKNNTDINKLSSYGHSKLDSEKEQKLVSVDCECTATSIPKNSDTIEEQENSKTSCEGSLIDVAIERVGTQLETEDSSHEQETTYDTAAEKIVKAADKDMNLKLSPASLAKEQSDKRNNFDASMYKEDGTFTDDEKVKNSLESTADKITGEFDLDGQGYVQESIKTDKIELPIEKIPEPPYTCKKLESHFDSETHYQTDEQLSQTKEESNNIPDQISEPYAQIQQQKCKDDNQIKPEPQIEGEHHLSTPLITKANSTASLRTVGNDKDDDGAGESETGEEQTTDSELSLPIEGFETTEISPNIDVEDPEKMATDKVGIKDGEEIKQEEVPEMQSLKTATESVQDDEAPSTLPISAIVQSEMSGQSFQEQTSREEELTVIYKKSSRPEYELQPTNQILELTAQPETADHVSVENGGNAADKSKETSIEKVITRKNNSEGMMTTDSGIKISYDVEEQEKIAETLFADNSKIKDASKTIEEANNVKEATDVELPKSETESVLEDISTKAYIKDETFEKGIQEEIYMEAESSVIDTKEGQRPENEFEGNTKVQEAFDLHEDAGYTCTENEKKAEVRYEAQIQENLVIEHPILEGLETQESSPMNDTNELEKEYIVAKSGDVSELLPADIMQQACSNEDVPTQKDQTMLSNKNNTDISKLSSYGHSKLDSKKKQKLVSVDCECTATSIHKNGDTIEEQENSKTSFEDSLTDVAIERVGTQLETEDSSHEQETTYDTPAEKIAKAADKDMNLKLSPDSLSKGQSDKKNNFNASMNKEDGTFTDDEKVKNSLESIADKITVEFDPDGQRYIQESTKTDKIELPVEKIPEPPYTCKELESHFNSEVHYETDEQLSQTKEESNNIPDQISETDGEIQQQKFKDENQIKPEPQTECQNHFSTPLIAISSSTASLRTEVNDKEDGAGESDTIEEQTTDSQLSLPIEEKVYKVKDRDITNSKETKPNEQKDITQLSFENDLTSKVATTQNSNKAINEAGTRNLEIQEEITQLGGEKEEDEEEGRDELEEISTLSSDSVVIVKNIEVKSPHKKSHGILSGVGSKVKHSISKVKKAITGKSSQPKAQSPK